MLLLSRWANFSHRTPPASMWLERTSARSSPAVGGLYCLVERRQAHGAVAQAGNYAACCTKAEAQGSEARRFGSLEGWETFKLNSRHMTSYAHPGNANSEQLAQSSPARDVSRPRLVHGLFLRSPGLQDSRWPSGSPIAYCVAPLDFDCNSFQIQIADSSGLNCM